MAGRFDHSTNLADTDHLFHSRRTSDSSSSRKGLYYEAETTGHFHAGKCLLATVGLPASGKTYISLALKRYLSWLGVSVETFHLQNYRRSELGDKPVPKDYFAPDHQGTRYQGISADRLVSRETEALRSRVIQKCVDDIEQFFRDGGQVAIYDALNTRRAARKQLVEQFNSLNIQTTFLEFITTDRSIVKQHIRRLSPHNPDYKGWDPENTMQHYLSLISINEANSQTIDDSSANVIRITNVSEKVELRNVKLDFLRSHIVFYIMNIHMKPRSVFFACAGSIKCKEGMKQEPSLSEKGVIYAKNLAEALQKHFEEQKAERLAWCSIRGEKIETAQHLADKGWKVWARPQLSALNCGIVESLEDEYLQKNFPHEYELFKKDTWLYRFPRSESYRDLAFRLEPVILQLENEERDVVIIAHPTVLRVIYAYLKSVPTDV